jgi:hypothetical protein
MKICCLGFEVSLPHTTFLPSPHALSRMGLILLFRRKIMATANMTEVKKNLETFFKGLDPHFVVDLEAPQNIFEEGRIYVEYDLYGQLSTEGESLFWNQGIRFDGTHSSICGFPVSTAYESVGGYISINPLAWLESRR